MRDEPHDSEAAFDADWNPVALRGGVASLRVPASWQRLSRDDGGLAFQSPGDNPVDLLVSVTTYRNPYGVHVEEAIQYLDRENVLPRGIMPSDDEGDSDEGVEDRRWIAYAVAQPPDRQIFVWKVADFQPPDHVRVVSLQLHVPALSNAAPDLGALIDRLGEEAARIKFHQAPIQGPVQRVTMRNVGHGDQVRFRLPWDWVSTREDELTLFHREESGSGTLRVAVHSFDHEGDEAQILARTVLRQTAEQFAEGPDGRIGEGSVEWLDDGEVMARFVTDGEEDGQDLRFFLWLRGAAQEGQTVVALFSFAFPQASRGGEREATILAMLEREIRQAMIGPPSPEGEEEDILADKVGFSLADLLEADDDDDDDDDEADEMSSDPLSALSDGTHTPKREWLDEEDDDDDDIDDEDGEEGGPIGNA
jgi:hypothetical protein